MNSHKIHSVHNLFIEISLFMYYNSNCNESSNPKGMLMMKKFISLLCVLMMIVGIVAVSAVGASAAVTEAKTKVDVKSGDEVTYVLSLGGVPEPIIGCDFSFYYDDSLFDVVSVADFTDSTKEEDWSAVINPNPDIPGLVCGNWSILKGVNFKEERHFLTVNLKAKAAGTGELSYFIYYLYDNNIFNSNDKPQITEYKFTCDVKVNGKAVLEDAQPQLNTGDKEGDKSGSFINSVTGDSKDADPSIPGSVAEITPGGNSAPKSVGNDSDNNVNNNANAKSAANGNANGGNSSAGNGSAAANAGGSSKTKVNANNDTGSAANETVAEYATTADGYYVAATDAQGNVTATSDQPPVIAGNGSSKSNKGLVIGIIIGLVVLAGGGAAVFFAMKKKKTAAGAPAAQNVSDADRTVQADEKQ